MFTTKVNIGAGKRIAFELTYEEVLSRAHGVYKHVVNIQPNLVRFFPPFSSSLG